MMENNSELKCLTILETLKLSFAFLFGRGFHVVSVLFFDPNYEDWQVTLATKDCILKIYNYAGKVGLTLSIPQLYYAIGLLELNDLINEMSGNTDPSDPAEEPPRNEVQSLEQLAGLLETYLDKILEKIKKMLILVSVEDPSISSSKPGQLSQYN